MSSLPDAPTTIGDLADFVRSKNAGPFWLTLDIFFDSDAAYSRVAQSPRLSSQLIAKTYRVDARMVSIYRLSAIRAIKISFPRPVPQGSFADRDMHSGQQYVLVSAVVID